MPYDKYGRTPEMAEKDHKRTRVVLIIGVLIFLFIVFFVASGIKADKELESHHVQFPTINSLAFTYTSDDDIIQVYVVTDPDTGRQYLVSDHGGITPRIGYSPA